MKIEVNVLTDNVASSSCLAEWGLSFLIEAGQEKILFDTGRSFTAVHNAGVMGKSLTGLSAIVLSHGHYDHTGGLGNVLKQTGKVKIVGHPGIFNPKYAHRPTRAAPDYIGITSTRQLMEKAGAEFILTDKPYAVSSFANTTGEIPLASSFEASDKNLREVVGGNDYPDPMLDDLALVIKSSSGLVIIAGCSHRGIVNTITHARKLTGESRISAVAGGFHLYDAKEQQIAETARYLQETGARVLAGHCTGFKAMCELGRVLGNAFTPLSAGLQFIL